MNTGSSALIPETGRGAEAAILNAALEAFGRKGFKGTAMRDIAAGAGTSLANLYNYFPSKSALLAQALRQANSQLRDRIAAAVEEAGDDAPSRMREAVRAYVRFVVEHQVVTLMSTVELRYVEPTDRESLVRERDATQEIFERIVAQGVVDGTFGTPYATDAARAVLSMVSAIATWYSPEGRLSRGELAEQHARFALALLESPLPPPVVRRAPEPSDI